MYSELYLRCKEKLLMGRGVHNQTCNVYDGIKKRKRHEISNEPTSRKNHVSAHYEGDYIQARKRVFTKN